MPVLRRPAVSVPFALTVGLALLAGCGTSDPADVPSAAAQAPGYPVSLDNCGTDVEVEAVPQRIVTVKQSVTEMVLALGRGDALVGQAFPDGPYADAWAEQAADVPELAPMMPSSEAVLDLEPDLVYAGWESAFAADAVGGRDRLQQLGVTTYVSPSACKDDAYQPDRLTFEDVFAEIIEAGDVLGAPDAAADLVAGQREELAQVPDAGQGRTALWWSSGADAPYVGGDIGAPAMIMRQVGLENVFADIDDTWGTAGWEQVVDRDPDVIVLVDATWNTAASKIEALRANPATAALPAVLEGRFVTVAFPTTEAGVRNVEAAQTIADQLAQLPAAGQR